ncbi:MAG: cytochrome c [Hyphomonas sp.]|nr:cytochrome c [Hyphomonas sp.]
MKRQVLSYLILVAALSLPACSRISETTPTEASAPAETATTAEEVVISEQDELVGRGQAIAETACAGCHAIGASDESPHPDAPALRLLGQTIDLDTLEARFAAGTISDHPDMPDWQFEQIDAEGLVAYLKSVQTRAPE